MKIQLLIAMMASMLCSQAGAQEAWCVSAGSICKMSETYQSTSYTVSASDGNAKQWTGDQSGSKQGLLNQPFIGTAAIGIQPGGAPNCMGSGCEVEIRSDSSILALLPNRDPAAVARFMRANSGTPRFGYSPISSLPSNIKRLGFRWYVYYDSNYEWTVGGGCNAKIAHSSGPGGWAANPLLTLSTDSGTAQKIYTFQEANGWLWTGHTGFDGFFGAPGLGGSTPNSWRGKWVRHEIIVRRPRSADNATLGYDIEFYTKDITNDTAETRNFLFSAGCVGCMANNGAGGNDFVWDTSVRGTADSVALHTEYYHDGCTGGQAFLYAAVAWWTTDAGTERIGPASEVEGGGAVPSAPQNFRFISLLIGLLAGGLILGGLHYGKVDIGLGWLGRRAGALRNHLGGQVDALRNRLGERRNRQAH